MPLKFARKWARTHSGNQDKCEILSFSNAFHGRSMGALATTANPHYREPFGPLIGGVSFAPFNDIEAAREQIGPNTAAVIVEPLQGEGGITAARPDFLAALRALCDEHGAALIFDEIQCGMGRTGTLWAYEAAGVAPDLMAVAKPLGGGLPIGAILLTQTVADVITLGDHGSTFAGGPFVTSVAGYVFDRISEPAFLEHVKEVGSYLGEGLSELADEFPADPGSARARPDVGDRVGPQRGPGCAGSRGLRTGAAPRRRGAQHRPPRAAADFGAGAGGRVDREIARRVAGRQRVTQSWRAGKTLPRRFLSNRGASMSNTHQPTVIIRHASLADAPAIESLVNLYAARGMMLPKSLVQVFENLREFVVAVDETGTVLGCAALRLMWHDLAEVRSLAVSEEAQGLGLGRRLVQALVDEARTMGLARVFALTYQELFFEKLGFERCSKDIFPQKVWADCRACPKRHCCDEIAMLLRLDQAGALRAEPNQHVPLAEAVPSVAGAIQIESITIAA